MNDVQFAIKIYAPEIEPKERHLRIFRAFDALAPGEFMELTNDHDPKPLLYQLMMERDGLFSWEYVEKGPELWKVKIGKK